jgi:hypothetical protein
MIMRIVINYTYRDSGNGDLGRRTILDLSHGKEMRLSRDNRLLGNDSLALVVY